VFYAFIVLFIVLVYLNNSGSLASLFPKVSPTPKKNIIQIEFKDRKYVAEYTKKLRE